MSQLIKYRYSHLLCLLITLFYLQDASASQRLSQMVFSFPSKREYRYFYNEATNTVTLEIENTSPTELKSLEHYDENLIRRILIKDLGTSGTELNLVLRDRNLRANISEFQEPFRLAIDIFDRNFQESRDPVTGMPLAASGTVSNENQAPATQNQPLRFVQPNRQTPQPSSTTATNTSTSGRRLLQPSPSMIATPTQLKASLAKLEPGIGKHWRSYPPYIYRIQTAAYHNNKKNMNWYKQHAKKAMTSAAAMADYASSLYGFGHENRALLAYQQVLHKDPSIFDQNPLHLWKFAELHLGQGNLTLADGYYQAQVEKHPEHPLANFAKLRRLDIEAIRMTREAKNKNLISLSGKLNTIKSVGSAELNLQKAIRQSFWNHLAATADKSLLNDPGFIPSLDGPAERQIRTGITKAEGQKTVFLGSVILLNSMLEPTKAWHPAVGKFAANFLKRFSGSATEPYRSILTEKLKAKINKNLQEKVQKGKFLAAIKDYNALPLTLKVIKNNPETSFAIATAYRKQSLTEKSIKFYLSASKTFKPGIKKFKSLFWLALTSGNSRNNLKQVGSNPSRIAQLGGMSRRADTQMKQLWQVLKENEKQQIRLTLRDDLEQAILSPSLLTMPANILLETWTTAFATNVNAAPANTAAVKQNYSPSANAVHILTNLAKRFSELGQNTNKRKTLQLLRYMKPKDFKNNEEAAELWTAQLLSLAEEYREESNYLEAGKLYSFTGLNAENFDNKAATLYKGGLLLYRSGRREDAIESFKKCSEDGNDRYYANLCTERLDRLNNQ